LPSRIILTSKLPTRTTAPFSTVITEEHAAEIATWVDKRAETYSTANNPYEFKLLLRGSRDGFTKETFWKICDKQANTIVVMKVKNTDEILGGYNPIKWDKSIDNYVKCNDSFIFSLKNGTIRKNILSCVKHPIWAIYCSSKHGPHFNDICMLDNFNQDD
ncbi:4588_t:CDS:1, partial [Ambispora leptoticha]